MSRTSRTAIVWLGAIACLASAVNAGFVVYDEDDSGWFGAVQSYSTITFAEFPHNTQIDDEYASLGVLFTDTDGNWIIGTAPATYPQDGMGLNGNALVELTFDQPMWAFASYFPGGAFFDFFAADQLLHSSPLMGGSGVGFFAGFTTDVAFDRIQIHGLPPDPFGNPDKVFFDSFYFAAVPSPAGLAVLALPGLRGTRRRRR
ncbi:MAG: hypothetical protein KDA22_11920 [Phycisphaerales bacterium]|nr:hypothetical protein [Phycisphaerales bacterium]